MKYQGIIFDLDGVICFTDEYHYEAWKRMADDMGIPFDRQVNNRLRGVSRMDSLEIILEKYEGPALSQADGPDEAHQLPGVEGAVEVAVEGVGQEEAGVLPGDSGLQKVPIGREEPVHIAAVQVQVLPLQLRGNVVAQAAEVHVAPGLDGEGGQAELNEKLLHKDGHVPQGDGEDGVLNEGLVAGGQDLPNEGPVLGIPPGVFKDRLGVPGGGGDAGGAGADLLAISVAADDFGVRFPFPVDTPFCVFVY